MLMLLAVAILLLNGGDCISPLFADQQSKDCCAQGECDQSQKDDPCCQTTPPAVTKYFQPAGKVDLDQGSAVVAGTGIERGHLPVLFSAFHRDDMDLTFCWPPGIAKGVLLPLLV